MRVTAFPRISVIFLLPFLLFTSGKQTLALSTDIPVRSGVDILTDLPSDQMNLFVKDVIPEIVKKTRQYWFPLIPSEARPPESKKGKVTIEFTIHTDGSINKMRIVSPSGSVALDRAAWEGLTGASPYKALPPGIKVDEIRLRFTFLYNTPQENNPVN
jgi:TonB family protein